MQPTKKQICGWGNFPKARAKVLMPTSLSQLQSAIAENKQLLARGAGKSYGDSSLFDTVINMKAFYKILAENDNWIEVEAGITIQKLLAHIVPKGKFLPVTPGIKSITIGGAVASNVHGKNHTHNGSFANHVISMDVMDENGHISRCSPTDDPKIFFSTFGAMGLNGIIVSVKLKLIDIETSYLKETSFFAASIASLFVILEKNTAQPFIVCWLDLLSRDFKGIVKTAAWAAKKDLPNNNTNILSVSGPPKLTIPFTFPFSLPRFAFRWYNNLYFSKAKAKPKLLLHYDAFFYPLESIKHWNRIFGPKGFVQYHATFPVKISVGAISEIIEKVRASKAICTLAVLKIFGKEDERFIYSFPMEGYHIALDFLNGRHTKAIIDQLDILVVKYSGRVYKCKDSLSKLPRPLLSSKFQSNQNIRYASSAQQ